ncbi:hypothetical protein F4604DRAFT_291883 [Suillus subluteus]|nr:hypothetical protein F4604DRAFT_291883 [Suillus subluteus]
MLVIHGEFPRSLLDLVWILARSACAVFTVYSQAATLNTVALQLAPAISYRLVEGNLFCIVRSNFVPSEIDLDLRGQDEESSIDLS